LHGSIDPRPDHGARSAPRSPGMCFERSFPLGIALAATGPTERVRTKRKKNENIRVQISHTQSLNLLNQISKLSSPSWGRLTVYGRCSSAFFGRIKTLEGGAGAQIYDVLRRFLRVFDTPVHTERTRNGDLLETPVRNVAGPGKTEGSLYRRDLPQTR